MPTLIWAHPDATERSPLLVAHDGPEYVEHSSLLTYLGRLPPLRAALIGPVVAVVAGGIGAVVVVALWAWRFPELRLATSFDPPDVDAAPAKETPA